MSHKQVLGMAGENAAVIFLEKHGYQIIERNFRIRSGEVDIIAIDKGTLSFVEVKARSTLKFGSPLEAITRWKIRSLSRVAEFYKLRHPELPDLIRLDAVAISLNESNQILSIELVKNIG